MIRYYVKRYSFNLQTIKEDVEKNQQLELMLKESEEQYKKGQGITTSDLLKSLSEENFRE